MQKAIVDLERAFYKMKGLYEEEIARLKRELEARTLTAQAGMVVGLGNGLSPNPSALPAFVMNTALTVVHGGNSAHPVISLPQIPDSSFPSGSHHQQHLAKRPRVEDAIASEAKSPNFNTASSSTTFPQVEEKRKNSISSPNATIANVSTAPQSSNAFRKVGHDWVILYNPKINPKTLDIDLSHSLPHQNVVSCVKFSPNGLWLATGSDRLVSIFEVATGKLLHHQPIAPADTSEAISSAEGEEDKEVFVRSLAFSPDSSLLVAGGEDWLIHLIDISKRAIIKTLTGHQQDVFAVEFTPNGQHILSGSVDKQLKIWVVSTGENLDSIDVYATAAANSLSGAESVQEDEGSGVTSVAISCDGAIVACGCADKVVRLWDWAERKLLGTLEGHEDSVYSIAFSSDASLIASGSFDNTIRLWERQADTGLYRCRKTINAHKSYVLTVAFTPDDQYIISGSKDLKIHVWNVALEATQLILEGHYQQGTIFSVSISRDGQFLASGSGDRTARIWALSRMDSVGDATASNAEIASAPSSATASKALQTPSEDNELEIACDE